MSAWTSSSAPSPADRIAQAVDARGESDYVFDFWTALGWTVLTLGLYSFYVLYQLMRRSRDHNRRKIALLYAACDFAAQQAEEQGKGDVIRPQLDRVQQDVWQLREMDSDWRDPLLWTVASIIANAIVWSAGAVLLDQDLLRHERYERDAEEFLRRAYAELGMALPAPHPPWKGPHDYVVRIIVTLLTVGFYGLWWLADLMGEGNDSFRVDYVWEDAILLVATGGRAQTR